MAAGFSNESKSVHRFSDCAREPRRMLPPIQGYESMPLVSLEEAVDPLIALVPEVERMAWTVKQNQFEGEHGLNDDESASILLYTMEWEPRDKSFCSILNKTLQAANRELLKPWFLYLRLIMTAFAKLPSSSHLLTVFRGVKLDVSAQYSKGCTIIWWGFSSCTVSIDVLSNERFLGQNGTRTLFDIECYSAKSIKQYSFYPEEEEFLLPPARQFRVMDCLNESDGLHIIQLKEIQPRFPLINPVPHSSTRSLKSIKQSISPPVEQVPESFALSPLEQALTTFAPPKYDDLALQNDIHNSYSNQTSQTLTSLCPCYIEPNPTLNLFHDIRQDSFRGPDASIAGHVSDTSQYTKQKDRNQSTTISPTEPVDHDNDVETKSDLLSWPHENEQMIVDNQQKRIPHQKQLSRYLSTVNRSLLDHSSDHIADFYVSQLNCKAPESVRHLEPTVRDKALMRQDRNKQFTDETNNKLSRSISANHSYQVRKEHLRYKQRVTTPTSFSVDDVADIYEPFALGNYDREIAIELERHRRERQGQLMAGIGSPPMYTSDTDFGNALKSAQPPVLEVPNPVIPAVDRQYRSSHLTSGHIFRTNELSTQTLENDRRNDLIIVRPPVVQSKEVVMDRARRTLTDDGDADVVHRISIVSPPPYSIVKQPSSQIRTTVATAITQQNEVSCVETVAPPDFSSRSHVYIQPERVQSNIVQPTSDECIECALSTSQQILFKDEDFDPSLRRPVEIVTSIQPVMVSPRRPQTKSYTPSPRFETIQTCQANRAETEFVNNDLSVLNIKPTKILNRGDINELNLLTQKAEHPEIPPHDYDHAQLITPIAVSMARIEQDIAIFEYLSTANIVQPFRNKLNEIPLDSGIVSLNTSPASEQPIILNASRINRLEHSDEQHLENSHEDDYYRRRIRTLDLLHHVEIDPNSNNRPIRNNQTEIFEDITNIPSSNISTEHTRIIDDDQLDQIHTLENTDKPVIDETIDQKPIYKIPEKEHLISSNVDQDNQTINRAQENSIQWAKISPIKQHYATQNRLSETIYEETMPILQQHYQAVAFLSSQETFQY